MSFLTATRRARLVEDARAARAEYGNLAIAVVAVIIYNFVGLFDIISTIVAIDMGVAQEANPLMRHVMDQYGAAWIATKLALQFVISGMVLWFPHRIVLTMFIIALSTNAFIVLNNFRIALGF
ncbi:MAG: DUF5658 family protein [Parvularculaceae bacterium]